MKGERQMKNIFYMILAAIACTGTVLSAVKKSEIQGRFNYSFCKSPGSTWDFSNNGTVKYYHDNGLMSEKVDEYQGKWTLKGKVIQIKWNKNKKSPQVSNLIVYENATPNNEYGLCLEETKSPTGANGTGCKDYNIVYTQCR
jgi:hypothetical protein